MFELYDNSLAHDCDNTSASAIKLIHNFNGSLAHVFSIKYIHDLFNVHTCIIY